MASADRAELRETLDRAARTEAVYRLQRHAWRAAVAHALQHCSPPAAQSAAWQCLWLHASALGTFDGRTPLELCVNTATLVERLGIERWELDRLLRRWPLARLCAVRYEPHLRTHLDQWCWSPLPWPRFVATAAQQEVWGCTTCRAIVQCLDDATRAHAQLHRPPLPLPARGIVRDPTADVAAPLSLSRATWVFVRGQALRWTDVTPAIVDLMRPHERRALETEDRQLQRHDWGEWAVSLRRLTVQRPVSASVAGAKKGANHPASARAAVRCVLPRRRRPSLPPETPRPKSEETPEGGLHPSFAPSSPRTRGTPGPAAGSPARAPTPNHP